MSIPTLENIREEDKPLSESDPALAVSPVRSLFTRQTGQALIMLGTLFKFVPPFNENIEAKTGDTLISIGKKLKGK